ncbi:MAG: hypothetical protein V7731_06445 [Amphritea sp.]
MSRIEKHNFNRRIPVKVITAGRPHWVTWTEAFFVRYKDRIILVQVGMFVLFMLLLFLPLFLSEPGEQDTPLDHFTVLANYLIWGGMVSAGISFGYF